MKRSSLPVAAACALLFNAFPAFAVQPASAPAAESSPWWQHAVIYEIYPRSFADANNTGTGNLKGITAKLDYLHDLGVDAIWITPCYPSPQVDFGYDISDYCRIDPAYGTMADFDNLVAEAKKRNIKIIMDLVMNHTSDKHPWFLLSRSSKDNPKRNWYIWRDAKPDGSPPNNWQSLFGHSAWKWDPTTKQYYYHFFYAEQPDLNWRNPQVKKAMHDVARFWLNKGVAGFRLDAVATLYEDEKLTDNPIKDPKKLNAYGDPQMENKFNHGLPEVHDALKGLRAVLDKYPGDRVLIGETSANTVAELAQAYGDHLNEVQLPMNFFFAYINKLSAPDFQKQIAAWDANPAHGWPLYFFSNHDQIRHYIRYGDGKNNDAIAKLMAGMLMTLRGTPMLYYGEELGMENHDPSRIEEVKDPIGKTGWPKEKGRDGERTPMQWTAEKNGGFSQATPWLPVANNYQTHNVASESSDPESILNFYKHLIALRKSNDALNEGAYVPLNESDKNVLSYLRKGKKETVLVALNMSAQPQTLKLAPLKNAGASGKGEQATTLLTANMKDAPKQAHLGALTLPPYAVYIGSLN